MISFVVFASARSSAGVLLNSILGGVILSNIEHFPLNIKYLHPKATRLRNTVVKTWVTWLGTVTHGDGVFGRRGEQALGEMGWKISNYELSFDNPLSSGMSAGHTVREFKNVSSNYIPRIHVPVVIEL
jgi:hypothetical protein